MARVLIVEDEPLISMMVEGWLIELDHEPVGPASSVATALELMKTSRPDAAILDVVLRNETSYPIARALAQAGIPFAFTTGRNVEDVAGEFAQARLLQKPFDFDGVREAIGVLLSRFDARDGTPTR